jgi:hypothetical protein
MILTIDTKNKTVVVHSPVGIGDIMEHMKEHYKTDWREYKISSPPPVCQHGDTHINNYFKTEGEAEDFIDYTGLN